MIIRQRYETSERATQFLKTQIAAVRTEIEEGEKKLSEYGTAKKILPLTASETPTVTRLSEVNKALTDATIDRVNKYRLLQPTQSRALVRELPGRPDRQLPSKGCATIRNAQPRICQEAGHAAAGVPGDAAPEIGDRFGQGSPPERIEKDDRCRLCRLPGRAQQRAIPSRICLNNSGPKPSRPTAIPSSITA